MIALFLKVFCGHVHVVVDYAGRNVMKACSVYFSFVDYEQCLFPRSDSQAKRTS